MWKATNRWAGSSLSGYTVPRSHVFGKFRRVTAPDKFEYTVAEEPGGNSLINANLTQSEVNRNFVALVPIYAELDGRIALIGRVRMIGSSSSSDLKLRVPKKPR